MAEQPEINTASLQPSTFVSVLIPIQQRKTMQLEDKGDSSPDSLPNEPTDSLVVSPTFDYLSVQENSGGLLPKQGEGVPLTPEKAANKFKNKYKFGCLAGVTIFLVLGIGAFVLSLSSVVSCGSKAKQSEAKSYVGAMNRAQQAYHLETQTFSNSFKSLGLGIESQTLNYNYSIRTTKTAAFNYGLSRQKTKDLKSYVGAVFVVPATNLDPKADQKETETVGILCEVISPSNTRPADPTLQNGVPTCSSDTRDITRYYK